MSTRSDNETEAFGYACSALGVVGGLVCAVVAGWPAALGVVAVLTARAAWQFRSGRR